ncbi:ankyrin repeat protein, partial [Colletotrichum sojae]
MKKSKLARFKEALSSRSKKRASQAPDQPQSGAASVLSTRPETPTPQPDALGGAKERPASVQHVASSRGSLASPSEEASAADISFRMWNAAYQAVKTKDAKLVETYERVVSQQIVGGKGNPSVLEIISHTKKEERLGRMKSAVLRCVEKAKKHENFRDGVIQTSAVIVHLNKVVGGFLTASPPAAMAWSGICALLPMLTSPLLANQAMVKGLQHVVSRMDWYLDLSSVLLEHSWESSDVFSGLSGIVEQRIVDLYQEILQFEMWSTAWCFQDHAVAKGLKTMVGLVDWETRRNDIEKIEATLDKDLGQYANREIVQQLRGIFDQQKLFHEEKARQVREDQMKKAYEIMGRFKTTDHEGRLKLNPDRVPGTCEWFEKHNKFKRWQKQDTGILLLSADPGCGKSVLARYLVETVIPRDSPASIVCYFFFKDTEEQKSLNNALCALLHQLFLSNPLLAEACEGIINSQGTMISSDVTVSRSMDRYEASVVPSAMESYGRSWKLAYVHATEDQIQKEIELVVDQKLAQLSAEKGLSNERQSLIREAFQNSGFQSEKRTYLWVSLVFEVLERNFDDRRSQWRKLINNPPKTVFSAYAKLLESVDQVDKSKVRVLLNLIIVAERPLTLQEMNVAIHVRERERNSIDSEADLDLMPEHSFRKWLIHACGFFVTVYNKRVFFIHQTAKEFLVRDSHKSSGKWAEIDEWQNSVTIEQAHQSMAESCIAYLSLDDFASSSFRGEVSEFLQIQREYGSVNRDEFYGTLFQDQFLDYATCHWTRHFQSAQRVEGDDVIDIGPDYLELYLSLFEGGDTIAKPWLAISELIQNPREPDRYRLVDVL